MAEETQADRPGEKQPEARASINQGKSVRFSRLLPLAGLAAGCGIAIGVPHVVLVHGAKLSGGAQTGIIIVAGCVGGLVAVVSAFFGIVIPKRVG